MGQVVFVNATTVSLLLLKSESLPALPARSVNATSGTNLPMPAGAGSRSLGASFGLGSAAFARGAGASSAALATDARARRMARAVNRMGGSHAQSDTWQEIPRRGGRGFRRSSDRDVQANGFAAT